MNPADYQPIENYAVVGDLQTIALVGMHGSVDFLCFPYFDSPSVFAALLDRRRGGRFALTPMLDGARTRQLYLSNSNILLTRFLSADGVAEISDFMPISEHRAGDGRPRAPGRLVRRVKCVRGEVRFRLECAPRFDYGRAPHRAELRHGGREMLFASESLTLRLRSVAADRPLRAGGAEENDATLEFTLKAGEKAAFILEEVRPEDGDDLPGGDPVEFVRGAFKDTLNYWRRWIDRCTYTGRWREQVYRSALTLKLLVSQRHGSIVAAPTFGLPESVGGGRNWDYRYCWIRDASFTLYGLSRLGFHEESAAFMDWIEARCREMPAGGALQIMYGLDGRADLTETTLDHLEGYRGSRPVRVGNGAATQLQLDIYGELMDAVYLFNKFGRPISHDLWMDLTRLLDWVCENWPRPDEGIWEVRGGQHEFLYSRVMCWAAIDRGVRLALKRSLPAPMDRWMRARDAIYADVFENFWDPKQRAFVQTRGGTALDASTLLMPLIKFISPTDPRWLSTLKAIGEQLTDDSLVYRYCGEDGLTGKEGTFSMCSFWYIECLSRGGDVQRARFLFEKMLGYANHVGLFSEEVGPAGEHLGNFPQAFSHLALISAAFDLDRRLEGRVTEED